MNVDRFLVRHYRQREVRASPRAAGSTEKVDEAFFVGALQVLSRARVDALDALLLRAAALNLAPHHVRAIELWPEGQDVSVVDSWLDWRALGHAAGLEAEEAQARWTRARARVRLALAEVRPYAVGTLPDV